MKNRELSNFMGKSPNEGGCGMSLRPEFYSGCGMSTLDVRRMIRIHNEIQRQARHKMIPENAADAFVQMVMGIERMSATDFLSALHLLDANDWVYVPEKNTIPGVDFGDAHGDALHMLAEIAVINVLARRNEPDDTYPIVCNFLRGIDRAAEIEHHPLHNKKSVRNNGGFFCTMDNKW